MRQRLSMTRRYRPVFSLWLYICIQLSISPAAESKVIKLFGPRSGAFDIAALRLDSRNYLKDVAAAVRYLNMDASEPLSIGPDFLDHIVEAAGPEPAMLAFLRVPAE